MPTKEWSKRHYEEMKKVHAALMKVYPLGLEDLPDEVWKPVPDYEELYHESNYGRTKSFHKSKQRILAPEIGNHGYLVVHFYKGGKHKSFLVHRLVAQLFIPNPSGKPEINHIDGNKLNNFVENLEWCTRSENQQHAYDTGLSPQGENSPDAKLTNEQVRLIRENPNGLTTYELAEMFGIANQTISKIQRGKRYKKAGGFLKKGRKTTFLSGNVRAKIRAEYVYGSPEFGCYGLAKKYGVSHKTIWNIVREG